MIISIKSTTTIGSSTEALKLICFVIKVVVIGQLLICLYMPIGRYNDMLQPLHRDNFGWTVSITRVVQVPCLVPEESCINNVLLVQSEKVAISYSFLVIDFFPLVCNLVPDFLSNILNDYVSWHQTTFLIELIYSSKVKRPFLWILLGPTSTLLGYVLLSLYFMAMGRSISFVYIICDQKESLLLQ